LRTHSRYAVAALVIAALSGCSAAHGNASTPPASGPAKPAASGTSDRGTASPSPSPVTAAKRPLGVLQIPAGARPWTSNTGKALGLDAFVKGFFVKNAWTEEEGLYKQRGFVSGTIEGWVNADGSQQEIAIAKFATSKGAVSSFDGVSGTLRGLSSPHKAITDAADAGVGTYSPTLDTLGNAIAEMVTDTGHYMIDVHEFTAATPDPDAAKSLLLRQFDSLKAGKKALLPGRVVLLMHCLRKEAMEGTIRDDR
jgi:hypothetical protein